MDLINRLPFFGRKQEKETIELIKEQADVVYETVCELKGLFSAIEGKNEDLINEKMDVIDAIEHKADKIRRNIEENLYSGAFMPMSRSEILGFTERVDEVADAVQDVSHLTPFIKDMLINDELLVILKEHIEVTLNCVGCLRDAIHGIDGGEGVKDIIHKCRMQEHNADLIERTAFKVLYDSDHEPKDLILLSKLIEFMGNISNFAEDASDTLALVLLLHRP